MSMKNTGTPVQFAQKLIDRLPKEMNDELKVLITRAEDGDDITIEIIDLLSPHDNIRRWMQEQISLQTETKSTTRGYGPLAGKPSSVAASNKWVCPQGECDESLPVIQEDEDAPTCEVHGVKMVRGKGKKG